MGRSPAESLVHMTELVLPNDTNQLGNLLGGRLMHWIDIAAAMAAMRHCGSVCVTASVDGISFLEPARLGDIVTLKASCNRAFRSSMEVGVKAWREARGAQREPVHIGSAYLTFVLLGPDGRPAPAPTVDPATPDDFRRYDRALSRRQARLDHRQVLRQGPRWRA